MTKAVRPGVEPRQTFCHLLEERLRAAGATVDVINAGVGGNTTADGLARFDRDVLQAAPTHVVIMFGLNDSWIDDGRTTSRLSVAEYRANLERMTAMLHDRRVEVILMTSNPAIAPTYPATRNQTLRPYVAAVRDVARREGLPLVDVYARFAELAIEGTDLNGLFTDAMHPNPAGQALIAEMLAATLAADLPD